MSAAAARRRKQRAAKSGNADPIQVRLEALLKDPALKEEAVAYEALQLAQSAVRRNVKIGNFAQACEVAYTSSLTLLTKSGRVSVSSQLLMGLVQVLSETHTVCSQKWVDRIFYFAYRFVFVGPSLLAATPRDHFHSKTSQQEMFDWLCMCAQYHLNTSSVKGCECLRYRLAARRPRADLNRDRWIQSPEC